MTILIPAHCSSFTIKQKFEVSGTGIFAHWLYVLSSIQLR